MRIIQAANYDELSARAAEILVAQVLLKPKSVLGLATGSTPVGAYQKMAEVCRAGRVSFSECHTVNLDEYVGLGPGDEQSYHTFMWENLFSHIDIPAEHTNLPDGKNLDAAAECARYDKVIADFGAIDIQILGIGHNGHIAFNEPADYFAAGTHHVELDESTIEANRRFFSSREEVPKSAYSMGLAPILHAKRVLLMVSGEAKADVLYKSLTGPITPQVPASILQLHSDLIVIADEAAAGKLA